MDLLIFDGLLHMTKYNKGTDIVTILNCYYLSDTKIKLCYFALH